MLRRRITCALSLVIVFNFIPQTTFAAPNKASDTSFKCNEKEDALGQKSIYCSKLSLESDAKGQSGLLITACDTAGDGGRYVLTSIAGFEPGRGLALSADQGMLLVRIDNRPIEKWKFLTVNKQDGPLLLVPPGGSTKFSGNSLSKNSEKFFNLVKNSKKFAVRAYFADRPGVLSAAFSTNDFFSTWNKVSKICKQ